MSDDEIIRDLKAASTITYTCTTPESEDLPPLTVEELAKYIGEMKKKMDSIVNERMMGVLSPPLNMPFYEHDVVKVFFDIRNNKYTPKDMTDEQILNLAIRIIEVHEQCWRKIPFAPDTFKLKGIINEG